VQSESSIASILAWVGLAVAIVTGGAFAVLQAVDGIANKMVDDSWFAAPPEEKASPLELQKGLGLLSMVPIVSFVFSKGQ
jgi:hypothetical protein